MLAPPKWVGIRPNGASLRCPHQILPLYLFAQNVPVRTAGKCVGEFIPLFFRTLCAALALGMLPRPVEVKPGADRSGKHTENLADFPNLTMSSSALRSTLQRSKSLLAIMAHTGPNIAFHAFGGVRMPPSPLNGYKPPHNAKQRPSWFWALV